MNQLDIYLLILMINYEREINKSKSLIIKNKFLY